MHLPFRSLPITTPLLTITVPAGVCRGSLVNAEAYARGGDGLAKSAAPRTLSVVRQ